MKNLSFLFIALFLALSAYGARPKDTNVTASDTTLLTFDSLSVTRSGGIDSVTITIWAAKGPDINNPAAYSIMEHLNETLGGTYAGNPVTDAEAMLNYYADSIHQMLLHHPNLPFIRKDVLQLYRGLRMEKLAETTAYVTMSLLSESYDGGAHGMMTSNGFTVRKSDGRILGCEIIRPFKDEQQKNEWNNIIRRQLQKELNVATDEELTQMLLIEDTLVPMPQSRIYLTPEGLHLVWQPYEIAPYAAGILHVTIPKDIAMQYLNITGQRLLKSL